MRKEMKTETKKKYEKMEISIGRGERMEIIGERRTTRKEIRRERGGVIGNLKVESRDVRGERMEMRGAEREVRVEKREKMRDKI